MRDRVYKGESLDDRLENAASAKRAAIEKMKAQMALRAEAKAAGQADSNNTAKKKK